MDCLQQQLQCMTKDCSENAEVYCCNCTQFYCETHNKVHEDFNKIVQSPHEVLTVEGYQTRREANSLNCLRHEKSSVVLACDNCYRPMCLNCFDDAEINKKCDSEGEDNHKTRTVEQVSQKIKDKLMELSSELLANELINTDDMKGRRKRYDEQMDECRKDLEKLDIRVQELHQIIDEFARESKESFIAHMNERKEKMDKWEKALEDHQSDCRDIRDQTSQFLKLNNVNFIREQRRILDEIRLIKQFKLEVDPQIKMSLIFQEAPLVIPIKLKEIYGLPKSLKLKPSKSSPNGMGRGYSVQYVEDGRLLHSGTYQITGLSFTPDISIGNNRINFSLCEHDSNLYVLQYYNSSLFVHILNMKNQTARQSVIQFPNGGFKQQIAVNDAHMAISSDSSSSVKIYSTVDNSHVLDVKHECIGRGPWGVAFINNTIVVGDHGKNQVSNLTISTNPIVKWTCTEIDRPSAIRVCDESRVIMVSSYSNKIYLLSYKGENLSTLDVPLSYNGLIDFAVYGKELAIAEVNGFSNSIKVYEMEAE